MKEKGVVKPRVCIIGFGYVGLTLGVVLAESGISVVGLERRKEVVSATNKGIPHFSEAGLSQALSSVVLNGSLRAASTIEKYDPFDVYIITVGTPLNENGIAQLAMISDAAKKVSSHLKDNSLVVLRSTVKIGSSRGVVDPILKRSGKRYQLAMCPERTLEGRALSELRELPQIIGAINKESSKSAVNFFSCITRSIVKVSSLETAEMIKLVDNTYRDLRFAFANEIARAADAVGINAFEVVSSGKLGYKRTDVPLPGLVGGPCLEKDPHILIESVKSFGIELEITAAARMVNERQPIETAETIRKILIEKNIHNPKVVIAGMAFKGVPETDDLRGSMSFKVLRSIKSLIPKAKVILFDPVISFDALKENFPDDEIEREFSLAIEGADVLVIANNHPFFALESVTNIKKKMKDNGFIYDYWNHFSKSVFGDLSKFYYAVGNLTEGNNG